MEELNTFIESNPDPRELKRALAVKMTLQGYRHQEIITVLQVSSGFISKWKQEFVISGIQGLKLKHQGSRGYLSQLEKKQVLKWLENKNEWNLNELEYHIAVDFGVTFAAKSSYYDLFHAAGISWKKSQKRNPRKDESAVKKKEEIKQFLAEKRESIESEKLIVLFVDECHLLWGDICGYVWGKTSSRIEIPIKNEKQRQSYYGAINYRQYLEKANQGKLEKDWLIKCIKLAPNAPEQNPIEDVWLQGKEMLRKYWNLCKSFKIVKWLFEWSINQDIFDFPKLSMYCCFS